MSFSNFVTDIGIIKRLTPTISSGRTIEAWSTIAYNVKTCIQPVSEELIALGQGDFYNTFTIYFQPGEDIQVGDKYVVGETVDFIIQGVQDRTTGSRRPKHIKTGALRK